MSWLRGGKYRYREDSEPAGQVAAEPGGQPAADPAEAEIRAGDRT
jgi:hypothetical protein